MLHLLGLRVSQGLEDLTIALSGFLYASFWIPFARHLRLTAGSQLTSFEGRSFNSGQLSGRPEAGGFLGVRHAQDSPPVETTPMNGLSRFIPAAVFALIAWVTVALLLRAGVAYAWGHQTASSMDVRLPEDVRRHRASE